MAYSECTVRCHQKYLPQMSQVIVVPKEYLILLMWLLVHRRATFPSLIFLVRKLMNRRYASTWVYRNARSCVTDRVATRVKCHPAVRPVCARGAGTERMCTGQRQWCDAKASDADGGHRGNRGSRVAPITWQWATVQRRLYNDNMCNEGRASRASDKPTLSMAIFHSEILRPILRRAAIGGQPNSSLYNVHAS